MIGKDQNNKTTRKQCEKENENETRMIRHEETKQDLYLKTQEKTKRTRQELQITI